MEIDTANRKWDCDSDEDGEYLIWKENQYLGDNSDCFWFAVVEWHSDEYSLAAVANGCNEPYCGDYESDDHWYICEGYLYVRHRNNRNPIKVCSLLLLEGLWDEPIKTETQQMHDGCCGCDHAYKE